MSFENDLFEALAPLVMISASPLKGRVYPNTFPQEYTLPAIRFQFVSVVPVVDICGDGDDETAEAHVQLDVVASTFDAMRTLRLAVMEAMRTFDPPAILENSSTDYDAETKTHRAALEYSIEGSST